MDGLLQNLCFCFSWKCNMVAELCSALSTIFQLYRGGKFNWWRKLEYPEKITDLPQVTDKHNVVSSTPRLSEI